MSSNMVFTRKADLSMETTIKPIETIYKDYKFRSRLEARWAVFFDNLGIDYEYEKEGFDLGKEEIRIDKHRYILDNAWYLPDFWLPRQQCWFEVKGECPTQEEYAKARLLARQSKKYVYIAVGEIKVPPIKCPHDDGGNPPMPADPQDYLTNILEYDPFQIDYYIYPDWPISSWSECTKCKNLEIMPGNRSIDLSCNCLQEVKQVFQQQAQHMYNAWGGTGNTLSRLVEEQIRDLEHSNTFNTRRLRKAYIAARQVRFDGR